MYDETTATLGGEVIEKEAPAKPKTRAQREADWKRENAPAIKEARRACCTCTPTRAQVLLMDQADGCVPIPID